MSSKYYIVTDSGDSKYKSLSVGLPQRDNELGLWQCENSILIETSTLSEDLQKQTWEDEPIEVNVFIHFFG